MWIVIDEASKFLSNALRLRADLGPPILQDQAQTIRKRGVFLMAATQSVSDLPVAALANFSTRIIFRTIDGANLRYLSDLLSLNAEQKQYLASLPERRALLSFPFCPRPLVIEIPELDFPKADVREIEKAMEPVLKGLSWVPAGSSSVTEEKQDTSATKPAAKGTQSLSSGNGSMLPHGEVEYLISIARDPFLGATARDKKNKITLGTGAAMRKRLTGAGFLILHKMKPPYRGGEVTLTEISESGWEQLRLRKAGVHKPAGRGGFMHTFYQDAVAKWIERTYQDSHPRIEAMVNGKAVDCLAEINGQAESFEVVMNGNEWASQLKEVRNIVKDLEAGVSRVTICAEDEQALARIREHVQRELGHEYIGKHQDKVQWRLLAEFLKE